MPGGVGPAPVVTVTESAAVPAVQQPVAKAAPRVAPAPQQAAATPPRPQPPAPLAVEQIPAPLPAARPAASDVVPAGAELEIPDGTQSVLVPAGGR
jgi:preprotein translocase subunit SecG